ncbi:MAG TPA: hypothetical protein VNG31_07750 [Candidatus Baltobacteraceae bacterium]|nr:hypothetical protein [Candidatus Baltobacteraceae bacterium]
MKSGFFRAAVCAAAAFMMSGALAPRSLQAAQESPFVVVDGDGWLTSNAGRDLGNWTPIDPARAAFGLQLSQRNDLPFDKGTAGATFWVRSGNCGPRFTGFGSPCGWQLGLAVTQFRSIVVGGDGMEIDGLDLGPPYARVVNSSDDGARLAGLLTNTFVDFSGVDDAAAPSWFSGFDVTRDEFAVRRAAPGTQTLRDLLTIDDTGTAEVAGGVASARSLQHSSGQWATRARLAGGTYVFRYATAFVRTPVCVASSEGTAPVRVTPTTTQCTVTSAERNDRATVDVMVIGNPN